MGSQRDNVVLITGSASGIGRAVAMRFYRAGWIVYGTDKVTDGLDELAAMGCETAQLDVTCETDVQRVVQEIHDTHGAIDCLVNNAGYGAVGPVEDTSIPDVTVQFDVNVYGPLRLCQAVLPAMHAQGSGRIINVSSIFGRVSFPGMGPYSASKQSIEAISETLRYELANTDIDVSVVEPAWVRTYFADRARQTVAADDRTTAYDHVYTLLEDTPYLDGGPLAVPPEQVATVVYEAATVTDPALRYPVGWQARILLTLRILPDRVTEQIARAVLWLATLLPDYKNGH